MQNKHGGYVGSKSVVDYSININPLGLSKKLKKRIIDELDNLERYPQIDGATAKSSLAVYNSVDEDTVIVGNGATELIYLFSRALDIENALIVEPTFTEYRKSVEIIGGRVEEYISSRSDFSIDIDHLIDALDRRFDAIYLCNPNNPTGGTIEYGDIERLVQEADKMNIVSFIDESFMDFCGEKSAVDLIDKHRVFILKSITKIYAVPGIRVGYGIASPSIIEEMNRKKEPWTVNSLALTTVESYIEDREYLSDTEKWFESESGRFIGKLRDIGYLHVFDTEANFVLIKLKGVDSRELQSYLLDKGFYIRICEDFYGLDHRYIRLAIREKHDNDRLIDALREFEENMDF